ncbi:MAG: S-layer homology domain-containing protein, partial [Bacillota bacterium]
MTIRRHRNGSRIISLLLTVVFIMMQFLMTAPEDTRTLAAPALGFSDVTSDNPNQPYINYVTTLGVISGFPDGTFRPASSLTRAQAAAILVKSLNLDTADITSSGFQDVPASHWASKAIGAAFRAGLLAGYGDGTFRPDRPLTRAEGIALIFRLTKSEIPPTALPPLQDVTASHWAAPQIAAALDARMMVLMTDGLFAPETSMSRGDMARALALMMVLAPEFSEQSLTCQAIPESGTVKVRRAGDDDYQTLSQPGIINPGDSIMTGDNSIARLTFNDGTEIRMEPKTELTLTNNQGYRYIKRNGEPGVGVDDLRLAMKSGEVFFALASDPNRQQTEQVTNPATPNRASTDRFFREANPSRASNQRFFRQVTPTPSRAPAQTVAAGGNVAWWKKQQQVKTRLTFDMPVGMCGARSTFGNISFTSGGGWSMNLATGSGFLQTGSGQTNLLAGHEGSVDSTGQTSTNLMSQESINRWLRSMIAQWMQNAAQQIDNNSGVQPSTATQQQQQQSPPPSPPSTPTTQQVLAALNTMRSGQPPTQQNVQQQQQQQQSSSNSSSGQNNVPTITAISESSTPPGAEVVITGSNFGPSQGVVTFGTAEATIISWSNTSITVIVPAGLSPGSYQVTVKQGSLSSSGY